MSVQQKRAPKRPRVDFRLSTVTRPQRLQPEQATQADTELASYANVGYTATSRL